MLQKSHRCGQPREISTAAPNPLLIPKPYGRRSKPLQLGIGAASRSVGSALWGERRHSPPSTQKRLGTSAKDDPAPASAAISRLDGVSPSPPTTKSTPPLIPLPTHP